MRTFPCIGVDQTFTCDTATELEGDAEGLPVPAGVDVGDVDPDTLRDIDFDDGRISSSFVLHILNLGRR